MHGHVKHVSEFSDNGGSRWPGVNEVFGIRTSLSRPAGLRRIGVHRDVLAPGQRSSLPHAEHYEEECVWVICGNATAEIDGVDEAMEPGSFVAFAPATGVRHTIRNDSEGDVELLVVGERRDHGCTAIRQLLDLWADPLHASVSLFAHDVRYRSGADTIDGPDAVRAWLTARGPRGARLLSEAVGWSNGFFAWQTVAGERGAVALALKVANEAMVLEVSEYTE